MQNLPLQALPGLKIFLNDPEMVALWSGLAQTKNLRRGILSSRKRLITTGFPNAFKTKGMEFYSNKYIYLVFSRLNAEDQIGLLKGSVVEIGLLRNCYSYNRKSGEVDLSVFAHDAGAGCCDHCKY